MKQVTHMTTMTAFTLLQVTQKVKLTTEHDVFRQTVPDDLDTDMDSIFTSAGTTTKSEAVLMIMTYAARHSISGTQLHNLIKLINTLLGKEVVPVFISVQQIIQK